MPAKKPPVETDVVADAVDEGSSSWVGALGPVAAPKRGELWIVPFRVASAPDQLHVYLTNASITLSGIKGIRLDQPRQRGELLIAASATPPQAAEITALFKERAERRLLELAPSIMEQMFGPGTAAAHRTEQFAKTLFDIPLEIVQSILSDNTMSDYEETHRIDNGPAAANLIEKYEKLDADRAWDLEAALGSLSLRAEELEKARAALDESVAIARAAGASWAEVGKRVGISQQAANGRWDPAVRQRKAEYQRRKKSSGA